MEKQTQPIFHKHDFKTEQGNICCEGCFRLGRTQAISEFKEIMERLKDKFCINLNSEGKRAYPDYDKAVCCKWCNVINQELEELNKTAQEMTK